MAKNKIPIWANFNDYPDIYARFVGDLIALSDKEYQLRVWYRIEGPEVDWQGETLEDFDLTIEFLKNDLRSKKITLTTAQIKALLRTHAMINKFERGDFTEYSKINDFCEQQLYIINHPYWNKIRKQAELALTLFREVPADIKSCKK
jgi:hypothetical protein